MRLFLMSIEKMYEKQKIVTWQRKLCITFAAFFFTVIFLHLSSQVFFGCGGNIFCAKSVALDTNAADCSNIGRYT